VALEEVARLAKDCSFATLMPSPPDIPVRPLKNRMLLAEDLPMFVIGKMRLQLAATLRDAICTIPWCWRFRAAEWSPRGAARELGAELEVVLSATARAIASRAGDRAVAEDGESFSTRGPAIGDLEEDY